MELIPFEVYFFMRFTVLKSDLSMVTEPASDTKFVNIKIALSAGATVKEYIQNAINSISTDGKYTYINVTVARNGTSHMNGVLYPNKNYGSGVFTNFAYGNIYVWRVYNSSISVYEIVGNLI